MIGKAFAGWLGAKLSSDGHKGRGAAIGVAVETIAKKAIPAIAAAAVLAYAYRKTKGLLDREPSYPSDATPSPPSA